jgi:hypothetical protein
MDFLRFANWGIVSRAGFGEPATLAPLHGDFEDLGTVLQDAHLRKDIARRADLTPFVREDFDRAA